MLQYVVVPRGRPKGATAESPKPQEYPNLFSPRQMEDIRRQPHGQAQRRQVYTANGSKIQFRDQTFLQQDRSLLQDPVHYHAVRLLEDRDRYSQFHRFMILLTA